MAVTRITGLSSGLDTESLVKQLMNAESLKMNRLKQQRQIVEWKQTAYRSFATTLQSFQNTTLSLAGSAMSSSIRLSSNFNVLTTSVLNKNGEASNAIKATVKDNKATGNFSLEVLSIAKKDAYLSEVKNMDYSTATFSEDNLYDETGALRLKAGDSFSIQLDGGAAVSFTMSTIDIADIEHADNIPEKIAEVINAKLAKRFGYETDATGKQVMSNGKPIQKVSFQSSVYDYEKTVTGEDGTETTETKQMVKFSFVASAGHTVKVGQNAGDYDALKDMGFSGGGTTGLNLSTSLSSLGFFKNESARAFTINGSTIIVRDTDTVDDLIKQINESDAGVTLSFDKAHSAFKLESNRTGAAAAINISDAGKNLFGNLGFSFAESNNASHISTATDAVFKFNDVLTSRETNDFELDGVAISLTEAAIGGGKFSVNLNRDVTKPYEMLVKFVDEYNKLIDTISKQINTARPKSSTYSYYEPLTDEERSSMSEKEVEMWEEKAKTGVLYRDDLLTSLNSQLRSMMYATVKRSDGSSISLPQIGITTSNADGYIGKLQIDEDKLRAALEKDPEAVSDLFTKSSSKSGGTVKARKERLLDEGLGDRINDIINNTIGSDGTIYHRAGLVNTASYKNNDLYKQLTAQDNKISDMITYLNNRENYYYSMFARMEEAMSKASTQTSALSSLVTG